jgi:hypothetical protein
VSELFANLNAPQLRTNYCTSSVILQIKKIEKQEMQRIIEMLAIIEGKMDANKEEMMANSKAWQ